MVSPEYIYGLAVGYFCWDGCVAALSRVRGKGGLLLQPFDFILYGGQKMIRTHCDLRGKPEDPPSFIDKACIALRVIELYSFEIMNTAVDFDHEAN